MDTNRRAEFDNWLEEDEEAELERELVQQARARSWATPLGPPEGVPA